MGPDEPNESAPDPPADSRKRRRQPESEPRPIGERLFVAAAVLAYVIAVAVVGSGFTWVLQTFLPLWAAALIGFPLGLLAVGGFIATMGNDLMDLLVGSVIVLVLALILFPVLATARKRAFQKQ